MAALLAAYTLAMFACYSMVPFVLQWSGAAVLNLSLLSSNLWAALARALLLGTLPKRTCKHCILLAGFGASPVLCSIMLSTDGGPHPAEKPYGIFANPICSIFLSHPHPETLFRVNLGQQNIKLMHRTSSRLTSAKKVPS